MKGGGRTRIGGEKTVEKQEEGHFECCEKSREENEEAVEIWTVTSNGEAVMVKKRWKNKDRR